MQNNIHEIDLPIVKSSPLINTESSIETIHNVQCVLKYVAAQPYCDSGLSEEAEMGLMLINDTLIDALEYAKQTQKVVMYGCPQPLKGEK